VTSYHVSGHRVLGDIEQWKITAESRHGRVPAGSVTMVGDSFDVRTDAGAKCFRGTSAYDVRMAAVWEFTSQAAGKENGS
jgi:hypothetical protein